MKDKELLYILLFCEFFIVIPPEYFRLNINFIYVSRVCQFLVFAICIMLYIRFILKYGISKLFILICLFWSIFILSTFINKGGDITSAAKPFITTFILCSTFDMNKNTRHIFLQTFSFYLEVLIFINFLTIVIFPKGLYLIIGNENPHFFLGHRNNSIEYIIPAICSKMLLNFMNNKKNTFSSFLLFIIAILTVILTWSANAILVVAFLVFSLMLPTEKIMPKILNAFNFFVIYLSSCILIIIYRLQEKFEWLIVGILHKSLDFTYRTYIWDKALKWIKKSPFIGYGYENEILKRSKISHPNSCHNYMLDFFYMGGIVLVIDLLLCLFLIFNKLKNNKTWASKILSYTLCGYFILWFATPIHLNTLNMMFLIFMFAYEVNSFTSKRMV